MNFPRAFAPVSAPAQDVPTLPPAKHGAAVSVFPRNKQALQAKPSVDFLRFYQLRGTLAHRCRAVRRKWLTEHLPHIHASAQASLARTRRTLRDYGFCAENGDTVMLFTVAKQLGLELN